MGLTGGEAQKTLTVLTRMRDEGLLPGLKQVKEGFADLETRLKASEERQRHITRAAQDAESAFGREAKAVRDSAEAHRQRTAAALAGATDAVKNAANQAGSAISGAMAVGLAPAKAMGGLLTGLVGGFGALAAAARVGESKQKSFNQAVGQFGVDGKVLIKQMQEGSKGMVDEVTLYERTNLALMLINKKAFAEAGGHTKVMTQLLQVAMASARATGQSVDYAFQSAVTGIARMSPLWLDNLGIGLRLGDVYEATAKKLGKSADSLTAAEKQTALLNRVLKDGMENVAKFGISSGGIKTQFEVLGARVKDLSYHLGVTFINSLTPTVKSMQELVYMADKGLVPAFAALWGAFSKLPPVVRDTTVAFAGAQAIMGPVLSLLSVLGAGGGPLAAVVKGMLMVAPVVIGVNSAFQNSKAVKGWIEDWQRLEKIDARRWGQNVESMVSDIGKNMRQVFQDVQFIAVEAMDNLSRSAATALDIPNVADFHGLAMAIASSLRDITGAVDEFLYTWVDAGKQGFEGAERLGIAAEYAADKYPGLRDEILKVRDSLVEWHGRLQELAGTMAGWRDNIAAAGAWLVDHKDQIIAVAGALAGLKIYTEVSAWVAPAKVAILELGAALTAQAGGGGAMGLARAGLTGLAGAFNPVMLAVMAFGAAYASNMGGLRDKTNEFVTNAARDLDKLPGILLAAAAGFAVGGPLGAAIAALAAAFETDFGKIRLITARTLAEVRRDLLALPPATSPAKASIGQLTAGIIRDLDRLRSNVNTTRAGWATAWAGIRLTMQHEAPAILAAIDRVVQGARIALSVLGAFSQTGKRVAGMVNSAKDWLSGGGGAAQEGASKRAGGGVAVKNGLPFLTPSAGYVPQPRPEAGGDSGGGGGGGATMPSLDEEGAGGDGKGGKAKKDKGEGGKGGGEGKDPVEQAWNTVNSVSGAIRSAIDAMKAAWTEWRGAAPDVVMRQIFDAMSDMADRMIELAAGFDPAKMAQAQEAAQLIQSTAGSMSAAIDAVNALARVRFASQERLNQLFETMAEIARFAFRLQEELLPTGKGGNPLKGGKEGGLETSVQRLSLAQSLAEGITAWAGAIGAISDALTRAAGMRKGANLGHIEAMWREVLDMAWRVTAYATDKAGGTLTPATFLEQKDVADALGSWLGRMGEALDVAGKMFKTRQVPSGGMAQAEGILRGAVNLAMALASELRGAYGEDFLIRLEDLAEVQKALAEWPKLLDSAVDLQNKLVDMRPGGDLGQLKEKIYGVAHIARTLTEAWRANFAPDEFLTGTEDAKLVADALSGWPKLLTDLSGVSGAMLAQAALAQRGLTLSDAALGDVLMGVARVANRLYAAARGQLGDGPEFQFALEDSRLLAETVAKWVEPLVKMGDILRPLERLKAIASHGAGLGEEDLARFGDLLLGIGAQAGRLWSAAQAGLAGAHFKASMETSTAMAQTFTAWLDMAARVGAAAQSLRLAGGTNAVTGAAIDAYFGPGGLLEALAAGGWRFVQGVMARAGAIGEQEISRAVAQTFTAWIDMAAKAADLTRALRRARPDAGASGVLDALFGEEGLLARIALGAWPMVQAVLKTAEAGEAQALSRMVADTLGGWVKVIGDAAGLGRILRRSLTTDVFKLDQVEASLGNIALLMRRLTEWWVSLPDPSSDLATRKASGDALAVWVKLVGDTAGLGRIMRKAIEPAASEWDASTRTLREAWRRAAALAEAMVPGVFDTGRNLDDFLDEDLPRLRAFSDAMQAALGVWSGLSGLKITRLIEPTRAEWQGAESILRQVWLSAWAIFNDSGLARMDVDIVAEWGARWKALWEAAGQAIGTFSAGAQLADTLSAQRLPRIGARHLAAVATLVRDLYTGLRDVFAALQPPAAAGTDAMRYAEEQAERAATFKTFLGLAADTVKLASDGAKFLTEMASRPDLRALSGANRAAIITTARDLFRDLQDTFTQMLPPPAPDADAERVMADQDAQLERFKAFLGGLSSSISAGGGLVDLLTKVNDAAGRLVTLGASTRAILRNAARDMVGMMVGLAADFKYGDWAGKNAVDQAAEFAGQLRDVTGAVGSVADTLMRLDSVFWEVVEPVDDPKQDTDPGPRGQRRRAGSATRRIGDPPSGPARRRRLLDVTREMLKGALDTARLMLDLMKGEWETFRADMEKESKLADRVLLEVGVYMAKIGEVASTVQGVMASIQAAAENPLMVLPFGESAGGKDGNRTITRWYSGFAMGVRQRRMEGPGGYMDQLKAGIQRAIKLMTEVINETAQTAGALPTDDARSRVALLSDAVHGIIQTILDVQAMPDIELAKLERFVEAAKLLGTVPAWGGVGLPGVGGGGGPLGGLGGGMAMGNPAPVSGGGLLGAMGFSPVSGGGLSPRGGFGLPVQPPQQVQVDVAPPEVVVNVNIDGASIAPADVSVTRRGAVSSRVKSPTIDRGGKRVPRLSDMYQGDYAAYREAVRRRLEGS